MVSFRVSPVEYARFREACARNGARSVSELARTALNSMVNGNDNRTNGDMNNEVQTLKARIDSINSELERLSRLVATPKASGASS